VRPLFKILVDAFLKRGSPTPRFEVLKGGHETPFYTTKGRYMAKIKGDHPLLKPKRGSETPV
jgi:hypothetical protein